MELKTYQARSMLDALAKVKADLGREAVILHTRTVKRGGVWGIGARSVVEITATSDPRIARARAALAERDASPAVGAGRRHSARLDVYAQAVTPWEAAGGLDRGAALVADADEGSAISATPAASAVGGTQAELTAPKDDDLRSGDDARVPVQLPSAQLMDGRSAAGIEPSVVPGVADAALHREVEAIRTMVQHLVQRSRQAGAVQVPGELLDHYTRLIGQNVAEEIAARVIERLSERVAERSAGSAGPGEAAGANDDGEAGLQDAVADWVREELRQVLCEMLPPAEPLRLSENGRPTIVALVGPTGVGKTTTIAKLAANMKIRRGKRVGLITVDSFRIAAVEQIKTYAQILRVPLLSVVSAEEMRAAVRQMADLDLILIDTAGRSQKDEQRIDELRELLSAAGVDQVHLVLSLAACEATIREAIEKFSVLGLRHVILTKLDEAVGFGIVLNVLHAVDVRLSYMTHGQSVPNDIEEGDARRLAALILAEQPVRPTSGAAAARSWPQGVSVVGREDAASAPPSASSVVGGEKAASFCLSEAAVNAGRMAGRDGSAASSVVGVKNTVRIQPPASFAIGAGGVTPFGPAAPPAFGGDAVCVSADAEAPGGRTA